MRTLFRRLIPDLPGWAQPDHPVLRYVLQHRQQPGSRLRRAVGAAAQVTAVLALLALGYQLATNFGATAAGSLHAVLYWPLAFAGVVTGLAGMTLTSDVISREKELSTWDTLRLTLDGAGLTFQARWVAVFFVLRGPLAILTLARLAFILGILIDLAQYFQGQYLDLLLSGITPQVSTLAGAVLLAATMTAALLQPLVSVGMDAAVGLLVAVVVRSPRTNILVRALLGLARVALALLALSFGAQLFGGVSPWSNPAAAWGGTLFLGVFGDQGLRLLNLPDVGLLWADVPYGLLIGPALLALTLAEAWFASRLVAWAARLAERAE